MVRLASLAAASLLAIAVACPAAAQDTQGESQEVAEDQDGPPAIIVTAQRREENLQDVPLAISAVQGDDLARAGIDEIRDLEASLPGLNITSTNGYLTTSIRGVGGNTVGPGVENQSALYIDDVYYGSPAGALLGLNNIAQVALLRGPQGTLFGRNTTAGVLQITTRTPRDELNGNFEVSYENYEKISGSAYLGGALAEGVKIDFAGTYTAMGDGWGTNLTTGKDAYSIDHQFALRSKLVVEPGAGTRVTLIGDYSERDANMESQVSYPGFRNGFAPQLGLQPDLGYNTVANGPDSNRGYSWGGSLKIEQDIGSEVELVSITAYREGATDFDFDYDGLALAIQNVFAHQIDSQFTQELRVQSASGGAFDWLVGGFYYHGKSGWDGFLLQRFNVGTDLTVRNFQLADSFAGFGQASYEVAPNTKITAGLRYTDETKKAVDGTTTVSSNATGAVLNVISAADRRLGAGELTWRLSVDHRISPSVLAYASYNRGFKSGGFNTGAPGSVPFLPEQLDAWEVGLKTDLFGRRVRFNTAAFYYDYKDIQVQQLTQGAITTINGTSAKIYGIDAEVDAMVSDSLRFTTGLSLISPKFGEFPNCPITPAPGGVGFTPGSCSGNRIPLAANATYTAALYYTVPLAAGELEFAGNFSGSSGYYFTPDNVTRQGSYALLGLSASWTDPSDHFVLSVFGRNLTDEHVVNHIAVNSGNGTFLNRGFAAPRTYGVSIGYHF